MRLASHLGMTVRECIDKHTYREYQMWMAYFEEEWKEPTLSDYYLMQIAQEVRRVLSKNPNNVKLEDFQIKFQDKESEPKKYDPDLSRAVWTSIANQSKGK